MIAFRLHCTTEHMYGLTLRPLIKDASVNDKIGTSLFQTPRVGVPVTRSSFLFFDFLSGGLLPSFDRFDVNGMNRLRNRRWSQLLITRTL